MARLKYTNICQECSLEFHPSRRENKYCSVKCFKAEYRVSPENRMIGAKNPMWGKKRAQHVSEALLKANLGRKLTEAHKEKIGLAGIGRKHSLTTRKKMSNAQKGDKGSNWQGGKTQEAKLIRSSMEYRLWREAVFYRDKYTCVTCGVKNGEGKYIELHPDHIKPFSLYPELRLAIDNGRTLCVDCHKKTDTYGFSLINKFAKENGITIKL